MVAKSSKTGLSRLQRTAGGLLLLIPILLMVLFAYFFRGIGPGMYIIRNPVREKLKGRIEIAEPEGRGAGFTIRFPKSVKGDT
jgi:signal transduction histidine kinase